MTLVQKQGSALTRLVDDSRVPAFLAKGFVVIDLPMPEEIQSEKPPRKKGETNGEDG